MYQLLGNFENKSGELIVSDPCYKRGTTLFQCELSNAKKGTWAAYWEEHTVKVDESSWSIRVAQLIALHNSVQPLALGEWWEYTPSEIGVDSGQVGIFDSETFRNDQIVEDTTTSQPVSEGNPGSKWYKVCCDITRSDMGAGTLVGGVVSSSVYDDGLYDCYIQGNSDGAIIAVKVVFM